MRVPPGLWRETVVQHEPVLGTVLSLSTTTRTARRARWADREVLAEIDRLSGVFSVFDPGSELSRWRAAPRGDEPQPRPELRRLLDVALRWQAVAGGLFNPAVGVLTARWQRAEAEGVEPPAGDLLALAAAIARPRYGFQGGRVVRTGDCGALTFNALAKGMVVDLAARRVLAGRRVRQLVLNVGGDLLHGGVGDVVVGVENPHRPYDNEPPIARIRIANQGMATSGGARRGFRVGERWYSHVLDPRTGEPVDRVASASVVAADAATADVVATLLSVAEPAEGLAIADAVARDPVLGGGRPVACLVVVRDRDVHTNVAWDAQAV